VVFSLLILGKAFYIQNVEGSYWKNLSDSLHLTDTEMDADRGTIYSEDGSMLSSSIPFFDVHVDFGAEGLREKGGRRFHRNLDSLAYRLSGLFGDKSTAAYRKELSDAYADRERYYQLKKNISFSEYREMREFPLVREGRNRSGFIFDDREKRLTPFGLLANRTIGLARSYVGSEGKMVSRNVGLELTYDSVLRGVTGRRLVRRLSGGAYAPIEGSEIEPENGRDLVTTIDINIQDIVQQALMKMLVENESQNGTCIVMEVSTGKIKAIANLGRQKDGSYFEDLNYAITRSEPGSTFKLVTMLSVLDDGLASLDTQVDLEDGRWKVGGRIVKDSEVHHRNQVTLKQAFELSSNVGMAKLVTAKYGSRPQKFIEHMRKLGLDSLTGVGLIGESKPIIPDPKGRHWSAVTLPWMGFGYSLALTPLHTLMVYNAVANGGRMMRPYLVNAIMKDGKPVKTYGPTTVRERICSDGTLGDLRESLEGVVKDGTATSLKTPVYDIAGKTGTALVADDAKGYGDHIYQSSFAGYFPAQNPRYSCIVVIRNGPHARKFYGSQVAGPVFREVADKLYALDIATQPYYSPAPRKDSSLFSWSGWKGDFRTINAAMRVMQRDSTGRSEWATVSSDERSAYSRVLPVADRVMPSVDGMGLRDALYLLENMKLKVVAKGKGRVRNQSILPGTPIEKGQTVYLEMAMKM
jgi:cell division protein FtsI (penicillin-binding protein 3)